MFSPLTKKIICVGLNTYKYLHKKWYVCDYWFFGLKEDIKTMWDIAYIDKKMSSKFPSEIYLSSQFLKKSQKPLDDFNNYFISSPDSMLNSYNHRWRVKFDKKWVNTFLGLVEEGGYRIGDKGLTFIDPLAHKVFSTKDIAGKKFFNPKGILKEMGVKPFSATEQSIYSDLQNEIAKHFAHSNIFARGTRGYDLSTDLARFSPEDAYRIARPLLDIENVSALKGEQIDQLLEATKAKLDKGVYKTTEEAILALTNQLKRLEIPNTDSLLDEYNNSLKVAISKQPLGFLSRKGLPTESILSVIPSGSGQLVKDSIKNIATKVDKVTDFIPGSKFAKRHGFTVLGLLGDTAKVLADEHQPKRVGTESEIGTTNYMRNQYAQAAVDLDRVSGWTGIASLAPGPQRWPLAGVSILTSFSADKARHQAATYKSDLDKVTDSLLPGTNPDDPGLDARFESKVNQGVYSHSEDNPVEIKEKDTNFIEELFWNVEKWKYGVK